MAEGSSLRARTSLDAAPAVSIDEAIRRLEAGQGRACGSISAAGVMPPQIPRAAPTACCSACAATNC